MPTLYVPAADTIPVAWGWFQFFLLLTFPLHLLAMNAMLGGLAVGVGQQFIGGAVRDRLAHRLAIALPLVIAFAVNFGVAPLLFLQVLYGQFMYTSSILMGVFWIAIVPLLIIAYYGAYLYDFKFSRLGGAGKWIGLAVVLMLLTIAYFFVNNMLLMSLPESFAGYFQHRSGTMLASAEPVFLPRYLHMVVGALAIGGLFVALVGQFRGDQDGELAVHARAVGMKVFFRLTLVNICLGIWYLLSQERDTMLLFMGGNRGATAVFSLALLLIVAILVVAYQRRLWLTVGGVVLLVYLMSFMRAWLRSDYLAGIFRLDQLVVVPQFSPLIFFLVTLLGGSIVIGWLLKKAAAALVGSGASR
ncbi:MAG: hypothetical protein IH612_15155 [Desulfofustis sp.]|nr:hypothetical protein [Desulfofustis sp.]